MLNRRSCVLLVVVAALLGGCSPAGESPAAGTTVPPTALPLDSTPSPAGSTTITTSPTTTVMLSGAGLPDPAFTPGTTNPAVTQASIGQTICVAGYTATIRPPASYTGHIKLLEAAAGGTVTYQGVNYSVHGFHLVDTNVSHYELDHLVSLEIGGAPADPRNLWMEPYEAPKGPAPVGRGSQTKDKVENAAHAAVCAGTLTLAAAQQGAETDWYALGVKLGVIH